MKWEYLVVMVDGYMNEHYINVYGDEGWELAVIVKTTKVERAYTFKRPKQKDAVIA